MMLGGGKIKEVQVKLHLSSRSEMHKVIETARQTVPMLSLAPAPVATPATVQIPVPAAPIAPPPPTLPAVISSFSAALGNNSLNSFGIPGLGNPQDIPQPAVIELPPAHISPNEHSNISLIEEDKEEERVETKRRDKERRRSRSWSRSRDRERKDRKKDRRDRSRSRERRRRDRSRSRESRRDRKRDRIIRSRSRDRSPSRRSRDLRKSLSHSQEKDNPILDVPHINATNPFGNPGNLPPQLQHMLQGNVISNIPTPQGSPHYTDPAVSDAFSKMQELAKKRNPNAFQGDHNGGKPPLLTASGRGGINRPGLQRERRSRFAPEDSVRECCVAIRNAPNHTSYGDVRRFFPVMIDKHGIKMINDNLGRRTGNIFVRFTDPRSKQHALQRKNNELKGAQVVVESLDDEEYEAAVDSFLPYRDDNDGENPDLTANMRESTMSSYTIIKVSDMPHFIKEHDIIKAFNDFSLLSITLFDCRMTRSKIALVQFAKAEDARLAVERKDRVAFNRRHPKIIPLTIEEFEKEKITLGSNNDIISRDQPPDEVPQEMSAPRDPRQRRQFDNGSQQGGPSHQAPGVQGPQFFVPFGQNFPSGSNPAFTPQNQGFPPAGQFPAHQFGGFPAPNNMDPRIAASNWANRPQFSNQIEQMPGQVKKPQPVRNIEDEPLDCVLMKGLPRDATDRTIVSFLSDTGAVPARIHLMLDPNGLPSGDCFCEFRSTQEARLAATKHGKNLEGCRVTVDIVPRSVVEEALEGPKPIENQIQDSLLGSVLPSSVPQFYDAQMGRGGFSNRGNFDSGRGFRGRGGFDRGGFHNRGSFDSGRGFRGRGGFDRGSRGIYEGRGRGRGRGRGGFENGSRTGPEDHDPALDDFGAPGCVVSMENVPFRATIDEIMQFFSEFELTQDDIIRRYNERGQPTGDARVAFQTPFDAQRAVKTRHMDTIQDRRINLNIL